MHDTLAQAAVYAIMAWALRARTHDHDMYMYHTQIQPALVVTTVGLIHTSSSSARPRAEAELRPAKVGDMNRINTS